MEFKPSGGLFSNASFTFKPPPGVPTLAFGSGDSTSRPRLIEQQLESLVRATQGREKCQRRISDTVGLENTELNSPVEPIQKEVPRSRHYRNVALPTVACWWPAVIPKSETSAPKPTLNPAAKSFPFTSSAPSLTQATLPTEAPQPPTSAPVEKSSLAIFLLKPSVRRYPNLPHQLLEIQSLPPYSNP